MTKRFQKLLPLAAVAAGIALPATALEVHVVERANLDGTIETWPDGRITCYTGSNYVTRTAPEYGGYIFTHWSASTSKGFTPRDAFGRAYDAAPYTPIDKMTLTANYVDSEKDADKDGIPDGHELYWYGNLEMSASSDTDGDGLTFAEEVAAGTNPLFPDRALSFVASAASSEEEMNLQPSVLRRQEMLRSLRRLGRPGK